MDHIRIPDLDMSTHDFLKIISNLPGIIRFIDDMILMDKMFDNVLDHEVLLKKKNSTLYLITTLSIIVDGLFDRGAICDWDIENAISELDEICEFALYISKYRSTVGDIVGDMMKLLHNLKVATEKMK